MKEELKSLLETLTKMRIDFSQLTIPFIETHRNESNPDLVDCGFLFREIAAVCDEIRKDANARQETVNRTLARNLLEVWAESMGTTDLKARGEYATGTAKAKSTLVPVSPRKDPDAYARFMRACGVRNEFIAEGILKIHVPSLTKWDEKLTERGEELPKAMEGATERLDTPTMQYRRRG